MLQFFGILRQFSFNCLSRNRFIFWVCKPLSPNMQLIIYIYFRNHFTYSFYIIPMVQIKVTILKISRKHFYSSLQLKIITNYSKFQCISIYCCLGHRSSHGTFRWMQTLFAVHLSCSARRWKNDPVLRPFLFSTCGICVFVLVVTAANRIVDFFLFLLWFICHVFLFKLHDDICHNIFQNAVSFLPNVGLKQFYCFLNMSGWNSAVASIKAGIRSEKNNRYLIRPVRVICGREHSVTLLLVIQ